MNKISPPPTPYTITQSTIDRYLDQPREKQLELAVGNNLYLFVTKIGSCIFKYRCNFKNRLTWITLGKYSGKKRSGQLLGLSLEEAKAQAISMNQMVKKGINPQTQTMLDKKKGMVIAELAEKYFSDQLPMKRTNANSLNQFTRAVYTDIVNQIGNYAVIDIDDDVIREKVIQPKLDAGSPSTARRARSNLKILLDYAIEELKLIKYNPTTLIKADRIYQDRPRQKYLTMNELGLLLNIVYSAPIPTQHKIALHLITLLLPRKLEIQNATWNQVDFKSKTFTIIDSKMGTDLLIKLPKQALALFKIQKTLAKNSNYIFPSRNSIDKPMSHNTLNQALRPLIKNRIDDFVVHDLRRTGATNLGELGYPIEVIETALNHSKTGILRVYHRTQYVEQREKMLADWANKIDALIKPELLPYGKHFPL